MLRFGDVCEVDETTERVRVEYKGLGVVSPWLFVSQDWGGHGLPDVGTFVWCLIDAQAAEGVVGGRVYADGEALPATGLKKWARTFKDGKRIEYDANTGTLTLDVATLEVSGDIQASGNIGTSLGDVMAGGKSLKLHIHTAPTFGGPTTPPT